MTPADPVPPRDTDEIPVPPRGVRANLLALGSAAVLAVYTAGFVRTKEAAERFENAESRRRQPVPEPVLVVQPDTAPPAAPLVQPKTVEKAKPKAEPKAVAKAEPTDTSIAPPPATATSQTIPTTPTIATTPDTAAAASDTLRKGLKDGKYRGWGYSQHGNIEAEIEIQNGRIVNAQYTTCLMAWSCDQYIRHLPAQVVERQSPDVDTVTRVTQSSDAFYWAVVNALKKASA